MSKIYVGQIGVKIILETGTDLSLATTTEIMYKKPDGITGVWPAVVAGTALEYTTTQATDLDVANRWSLQAHISGVGFDLLGETATLNIYGRYF